MRGSVLMNFSHGLVRSTFAEVTGITIRRWSILAVLG